MNTKLFNLLIFTFILTSCSINDNTVDEQLPQQREIYQWHLVNVSGGLSGVNIDYPMESIIWVFSVDFNGNGSLLVENNNTNSSLEDGLNTGSYAISTLLGDSSTSFYLYINDVEFGKGDRPSNTDLTIDQNSLSTGTRADGYVYTFKRKVILVDIN